MGLLPLVVMSVAMVKGDCGYLRSVKAFLVRGLYWAASSATYFGLHFSRFPLCYIIRIQRIGSILCLGSHAYLFRPNVVGGICLPTVNAVQHPEEQLLTWGCNKNIICRMVTGRAVSQIKVLARLHDLLSPVPCD